MASRNPTCDLLADYSESHLPRPNQVLPQIPPNKFKSFIFAVRISHRGDHMRGSNLHSDTETAATEPWLIIAFILNLAASLGSWRSSSAGDASSYLAVHKRNS